MTKYTKHIVILGSARSGTSWFSELIAKQHRYRMLFEPEHEHNTQQGKLICDKYLKPNNATSSVKRYFNRVFQNRVDSDWIGQISNRKWKRHLWPFIPVKYVIKFVRCNLAVSLLMEKFKIPTVFIIRNPYDVLASQSRVKFPWLYDLSHFTAQNELCDLIKEEYGLDIRDLKEISDLEKLSLRWCIENAVPFLDMKNTEIDFYKLEDLKKDANLFLKICEKYQLKPLDNLEKEYSKPSSKTHPRSEILTGKNSDVPFTKEQYAKINRFLDVFQIDLYPRKHA